jgi:sec-independent protein translocase protein TatA/sec-independent protein translocase protein TatB
VSFNELIILMVIALILFGPEDLPDVARAIGRIVFEIKKILADVTREFQDVAKTPSNLLEKAFEETTKRPSATAGANSGSNNKEVKANSSEPQGNSAEATSSSETEQEELLTYEEDPLAELPEDMVSYEKKGASR